MFLSEEDRRIVEKLIESNTRLSQEVAVSNVLTSDIKKVLFGEKADGLLYEFAAMRGDVKSIPGMAKTLSEVELRMSGLERVVAPLVRRVKAIDRYIFRQRVQRGVVTTMIAVLSAFVTTLLTWGSGIFDLFSSGKVPHK